MCCFVKATIPLLYVLGHDVKSASTVNYGGKQVGKDSANVCL